MDSPILRSLFSKIALQPQRGKAVYLQLAEAIMVLIRQGRIPPGGRLPSSRELADIFRLNRLTITRAFQELEMQGWLESHVGRGTFVASRLPESQPMRLDKGGQERDRKREAGFEIRGAAYLRHGVDPVTTRLHLDDGFPDPSLAPLKELYRAYRAQLERGDLYGRFGSYGQAKGSGRFLDSLARYLNLTRGLDITERNILSVRGTVMGINLVCNGLIQRGDVVVAGVPGWRRAEANFQHAGAVIGYSGRPSGDTGGCAGAAVPDHEGAHGVRDSAPPLSDDGFPADGSPAGTAPFGGQIRIHHFRGRLRL
ncbi:GntR family transcriptional regulator [Parapedobacter sp. ISTM3]|nr:GntR family transcriptional regulator [Parapedobacter sp. ISTM3]